MAQVEFLSPPGLLIIWQIKTSFRTCCKIRSIRLCPLWFSVILSYANIHCRHFLIDAALCIHLNEVLTGSHLLWIYSTASWGRKCFAFQYLLHIPIIIKCLALAVVLSKKNKHENTRNLAEELTVIPEKGFWSGLTPSSWLFFTSAPNQMKSKERRSPGRSSRYDDYDRDNRRRRSRSRSYDRYRSRSPSYDRHRRRSESPREWVFLSLTC